MKSGHAPGRNAAASWAHNANSTNVINRRITCLDQENSRNVKLEDFLKKNMQKERNRLLSILLHNSMVGHMWHHLRARIDNIRLRILRPNIQ